MKKIKLLPSVLMLALCIGILGIGIYAANPTNNVITGTITVNAANAGIKVEVFKGTDTSVDPIGTDTGRATTRIELTGENAIEIDASEAENLSQVQAAVYTVRLSTTSNIKLVVDTETIEWRDGTTATGTITDALKITKVHTPAATDTSTGLAYFNNAAGVYDVVCSINLTDLYEEDFTSELDLVINVYKLDDWVKEGNTGINGIDYLHLGKYPQSEIDITGLNLTADGTFKSYDKDATISSDIDIDHPVWTDGSNRYVEYNNKYFLIEPLKWIIINQGVDGIVELLCDVIVEGVSYQKFYEMTDIEYAEPHYYAYAVVDGVTTEFYANNYKYSILRKFLNEIFYNSTFNDCEKAIINTTLINNSYGGDLDCEDTNDKVFALSSDPITSGFLPASDFGRETGAMSGYWWLRQIGDVPAQGWISNGGYGESDIMSVGGFCGCAPAINIAL